MLHNQTSFQAQRPSDALRAEDTFMRDHGTYGPCAIYAIVTAIAQLPDLFRQLVRYPSKSRAILSKIAAPIGVKSSGKS